ncbi:hypothetical protein, partial [Sphingomonas sp. ABOLF]|uniref:hypothetical protein n=1 Tax=Sphingomonas sp. ABOLF TaxID=1985879 RepID=UPI0019D0D3F4
LLGKNGRSRSICSFVSQNRSLIPVSLRSLNQIATLTSMGPDPKQNSLQTLLLISNFNGFLEQSKKKKEAQPQISELFKYSSGKMNAAVWIEPQMSAAKLGLFPFLMEKVLSKLPAFAKSVLGGSGNEETSFAFAPPMKMEKSVIVRLCVMPVELVKGSL